MDKILDFFHNIDSLKHREREGWKKIGVKGTRDTIASHSFGASMIAWILAEREGFDSEKLVKMLLVHDLVMAYIDDYTPEDPEFSEKKAMEKDIMPEMLEDVPDEIRADVKALMEELQSGETSEARLAKEADKLDTLFQAYLYSEDLGEDFLSEFVESYEDFFESDTGRDLLVDLRKEAGEGF